MGKFNAVAGGSTKVKNKEGSDAYALDPKVALYSAVCTAALSNKFYESEQDQIDRIKSLIKQVPAEFTAKLAIYAREQMYLRSIPLVLCVELAKATSKPRPEFDNNSLVSRTVGRVIQRPDEITELLACYAQANPQNNGSVKKLGKLSKQIQKGIAYAFNKFDKYSFAKYNRDGEIKLRDALFLVHPKPKNDEQQALFNKIVEDKLEVPYTWETELSDAGQKGKSKADVWSGLIESGKLGYMALMRNLRNILESGVGKGLIMKVCQQLEDKGAVLKSKQFPFRFLSAYNQIQPITGSQPILDALEAAMIHSANNICGFDWDDSILIACDVSSSMWHPISERSTVQFYDIGLCLAMLLQHRCADVTTGIFGDTWLVNNLPKNNILNNVMQLRAIEGKVGYSTNGYKVLEWAIKQKAKHSKIMMFTDCQMWDSEGGGYYSSRDSRIPQLWNQYKQDYPDAKLYLFDLAGHGDTPISTRDGNVNLIAGWSDKVFDVLSSIEEGGKNLTLIESIEI